jgi:RNA polymerase sigma factor (sigma-70 family)
LKRWEQESDPVIVAHCREGSESAWEALVNRYKSLVYSSALRTGLDVESADEVFQQVWVELYQSLHRIREPQALARWLAVTARRVAYKHAIRRREQVDGVLEEMTDPAALPGAELERLQQLHRLEQLLDQTGKTCSALLRLLFLDPDEPSYQQISRKLALSVGSIGPIRARCLGRLRRLMETAS